MSTQESKENLKWSPIIFITGGKGLVGSRFHELASREYAQVISTDIDELDITGEEGVRHWVEKYRPDVLVNFSAMTNVGAIEKERGNYEGVAWKVNALGPKVLTEACQENNVFLIHISTDYVFSSYPPIPYNDGPFAEDSQVAQTPEETSWYGWTKKEGEGFVQEVGGDYAIVRIARPIRASYQRPDFARNILELYKKGKLYPMIQDITITPTYIDELVETLLKIIEMRAEISGWEPKERIFHVVSRNVATPLSYASHLVWRFTGKRVKLEGITIEDFYKQHPEMYQMPRSGLHCYRTQKELGMEFMGWQEQIEELYQQNPFLYKNIIDFL